MGIIKRQTIKTTIVTYIGVALGALNTLWLYPKYLEAEEIGLISILVNISLMIAPLAQFGVGGIIMRYYPKVREDENKKGAFVFFMLLLTFAGFFLTMIMLFLCRNLVIDNFSSNSPLLVDYLIWLVPLSFILVGRNLADNFSRVHFRITMPRFFKEVVYRILLFALVIIYSMYNLDLDILVSGLVGVFAINLILVIIYLKKMDFFHINWNLKLVDKKLMKNSMEYGVYIILSGLAGTIVTKIDSYMIASMVNLENTGIFTIALYIGLAIEMPKRSMNFISLPVIGEAMKNNDLEAVEDLYKKSSLIQMIIGSLLLICVWINIDDLFSLIPNSEIYSEGKYVVLFIGLAVLFDMSTGVNNEIFLMSDFFRLNFLIVGFLIVIAIINNQILIPIYGITGAAMATAISIFLYNILKFVLLYIKLGIHPFEKKTLVALVIATVFYLLASFLPSFESAIINIVYKSILICTLYLLVHYYLKTSDDLKKLTDQSIGMLSKFVGKKA